MLCGRTELVLLLILIWRCRGKKTGIISWLILRMTLSFMLFFVLRFKLWGISFSAAGLAAVHGVAAVFSFLLLVGISGFKIFFFTFWLKGVGFWFLSKFWAFGVNFTLFGSFWFLRFGGIIVLKFNFLSWLSRFSSIMRLRPVSFPRRRSWFSLLSILLFLSWSLRLRSRMSFFLLFLLIKNKSRIPYSLNRSLIVKLVLVNHSRDIISHIFHKSKSLKYRNVLNQLLILHIIIPIHNRHPTFRLEQVRDWRIV